MHSPRLLVLLALLMTVLAAHSQVAPEPTAYTRLNTIGIFGEYSNDSSHILLGESQNRKLLDFGGFYARRVILNHIIDGQYMLELRPIMIESDPVTKEVATVTSSLGTFTDEPTYFANVSACHPYSVSSTFTIQGVIYTDTDTFTCGHRQWTFGEGLSPAGFKANFLPHRRIQPVLTLLGGYMFATRPIPTSNASGANFTFSFGAGLEFYRSATRSIRAEYRYHHLSNAGTANNPGIDNQIIQITYSLGR